MNARLKRIIDHIARHDSQSRFEQMGVTVLIGQARFTGKRSLDVDGQAVRARRIVIATGSRASLPPIEGLGDCSYLTHETIFDLTSCPQHLIVIGAGPIGLELAQAHRRLGAQVTVFEAFKPLAKDDPDLAAYVLSAIKAAGIQLVCPARIRHIASVESGIQITHETNGQTHVLPGSHLLVAAGRQIVTDGLDLDAAGVRVRDGRIVHKKFRTDNKHVYVIGDAAGGAQFTHLAGYHATLLARALLFRLPIPAKMPALPWVTYTDPELAQVGITQAMAEQKQMQHQVLCATFDANDRALTESQTEGMIKIIVGRRGRILGCSIAGPHAGEQIGLWALAMHKKMNIKDIASLLLPYPTMNEISRKAAVQYYSDLPKKPRVQRLVRWLSWLG